jgi:hypothetical protein
MAVVCDALAVIRLVRRPAGDRSLAIGNAMFALSWARLALSFFVWIGIRSP